MWGGPWANKERGEIWTLFLPQESTATSQSWRVVVEVVSWASDGLLRNNDTSIHRCTYSRPCLYPPLRSTKRACTGARPGHGMAWHGTGGNDRMGMGAPESRARCGKQGRSRISTSPDLSHLVRHGFPSFPLSPLFLVLSMRAARLE